MAGPIDAVELSHVVSHALRHEPWLYELELEPEGWVTINQLLDALQAERTEWRHLSAADLASMIKQSTKPRHEIKDGKIRAVYGHSVPGRVIYQPRVPYAVLYHGTAPGTARAVLEDGLRPMGRQYVHLSVDTDMAVRVGSRKDSVPVVLVVNTANACRAGVKFYPASDIVWLADYVPAAYLSVSVQPPELASE